MKKLILIVIVFLSFFVTYAQKRHEILQTSWPSEYHWKIIDKFEDSLVQKLEIIPAVDSVQNWQIMGFMSRTKKVRAFTINEIIKAYQEAALQESPLARFAIVEKDSIAKNSWVIFKVDNPSFPNDPIPESHLNYVILGEEAVYINFVAIKKEKLSDEFVAKWSKVFKSSKLTYRE